MCIGFHLKYALFLSGLNETWTLSIDLRKILEYQITWKSVQWEPSCVVWTDRRPVTRTDMPELIISFRSFASAPEKWKMWSRGLRKYSSAISRASLTRGGYNAIANLANALCITRTFAYACQLFSATSVKTLRPISSISWIIFILRVSKTRSLAWLQLSRFRRNGCSMKFIYVCDVRLAGLTLILLTWRIWWAPNKASKWQMGFNSAFEVLMRVSYVCHDFPLQSTRCYFM
jgi:hypothetical protein